MKLSSSSESKIPTVLVLGSIWPEPRSSAAGIRTMNLLDACRHEGWRTLVASPSIPNEAMQELNTLGFETVPIQPNDASVDDWLRGLAPDLVIFDRFFIEEQFGWRVKAACPGAARVLDTIDLHFLRGARQAAVGEEVELRGNAMCREVAAILRSDLTLLVSDTEENLLVDRFDVPRRLLTTIRFAPAGEPIEGPKFEERRGFSVIGNFRHPPNRDGLEWMRVEIWPSIRRQIPGAELRIFGAYPTREWMDRDDPRTGFRVMGPARDAREALSRARVNLAPLRFGAGIKGKILDGWWSGTPCATTPVGAEGMSADLPWGGEVRESAEDIARAAVLLHEDPAAWAEASLRSKRIVREVYGAGQINDRIRREFRVLLEELAERRAKNALGELLWHQSLRATEYFSRWIELKTSRGKPGS